MVENYDETAMPVEWGVSLGVHGKYAIIRRVSVDSQTDIYRAVTWAATSQGRELIGYYDTLEDATRAAWVTWATTMAIPTDLMTSGSTHREIPPMPEPTRVPITRARTGSIRS